MILSLEGEVELEMFNRLIEAYNELEKEETLAIYLSSHGGSMWEARAIIDLINKFSDKTLLIGYGHLESAAILIWMNVKCEKELLANTYAMIHLAHCEIRSTAAGPKEGYDKFRARLLKDGSYEMLNLCKELNFTDEQTAQVKTGGNVYLTFKEIQKALKIK